MTGIRIGAIFSLIFLFGFIKSESSMLLSVATIFRHGSRAPIRLYKNDPYRKIANEIWPDGFQELTNIGKNQHHELGKWFREYYNGFIPKKYQRSFIKVLSSNSDRCVMSAATNLAGLFPPTDEQIWNKNINWQPIPIHTIPENEDALLAGSKPCPRHDKLMQSLQNQNDFKQYMKDIQPALEFISKNSGQQINNLDELMLFHDTLFIESYFGLIPPKWTDKVYPNITFPALIYTFKLPTYTPHLARLKSGPLIDYLTKFFENVITNPKDSQKFLMLSGHDITMVHLLNSLGLYDNTWPDYASAIIFELRSKENRPFINMYFKNSTITKLILNNCAFDCSFNRFKTITEYLRLSPENWQKECFN